MTLISAAIIIGLATLLSAVFSGVETGVYAYDSVEETRGKGLSAILRHPEPYIIACLIGTNLAVSFATLAFTAMLVDLGMPDSYHHTAEIFVLTPWLFVLAEILPKGLFQTRAQQILPPFTWFLRFSRILFSPVILVMQLFTQVLLSLFGVNRSQRGLVTRKRLAWLLQDREGGLSSEQTRMATNVFELKERQVTSVMEPCRSAARVPISMTVDQAARRFLTSDFGFLMVYDRKPEEILGIVYMSQILLSEKDKTIQDLLVEIPEIQAKSSLTAALGILRKNSVPVARVTGTKGGVIGLLFTRRVIQQIVGELQIW